MARKKRGLKAYIDDRYRDIVEEAQARFDYARISWRKQEELSLADLEFLQPGGQWLDQVRGERESDGRPCLEIDRLTPFINQVVNDQRQARPQPQVNPLGDGASKETAEVLQGMIRHIMNHHNGEIAIDTAFESMVRCGLGYFRVLTDYEEGGFDQEIKLDLIENPFMVKLDPAMKQPDGSDADFGFISAWVPRSAYLAMYPDSLMAGLDIATWQSIGADAPDWAEDEGEACLIVEYFKRVRVSTTLYQLQDGSTTDKEPADPSTIKDKRTTYKFKVMWYKLNAVEVLDTTEWPGKFIPIVPVYGNMINVNGDKSFYGLTRTAKEPQRLFNYFKSAQAESIALAPKAPFIGPKGFTGPMRQQWGAANRRNFAFLEYEPTNNVNGPLPPPMRQAIEPPIQGITMAMSGAADDLKAVTGMYDPTLGTKEGDQSGVAIRQLQRQGQLGNFQYQDNLARSIRHLGRILIDLIPKIYDTARVVKIIKPDDSVDMVTINTPTVDAKGVAQIYDPSVGKYDVVISVGPSYQTKRQENLALLESLLNSPLGKLIATAAPDLIASELDFGIAPQLQERFKKLLPPQLADEGQQQPQIPPQVQQQMQQMHQMIEMLTQALEKEKEESAGKQADRNKELEIARMNNVTKLAVAELAAKSKLDANYLDNWMETVQQYYDKTQDAMMTGAPMPPAPFGMQPQMGQQPPDMSGASQGIPAPSGPAGPMATPGVMPGQPGAAPILGGNQ